MRYAIRTLLRSPTFTSIAVVTIAIGIAANTAIFSVVNGVLLRPLPFSDEARLVRVWTTTADEPKSSHSAGEFQDLRRNNHTLEAIAGFREEIASVVARAGNPEEYPGGMGDIGVLRRAWRAGGDRAHVQRPG